MSSDAAAAFESALIATVRALSPSVPTPRHDPFFGLDRPEGPGLRLLERLTRHGDFRKYVFVLDAGAGLGGAARWLALRYGCRVVCLDECRTPLEVSRSLTRRAGLADRVSTLAGRLDAIPVCDAAFTQIWSVESLHRARDRSRMAAELFRVLRPGSPLAMQTIACREPADGRTDYDSLPAQRQALVTAGFVDVVCDDVTREREETSPVVLSARVQLARRLAETGVAAGVLPEAIAPITSDIAVYHLFARRPSV